MSASRSRKPISTRAQHGQRELDLVTVDGYSLGIADAQGLVGDQASETAFREVIKGWQQTLAIVGRHPFGSTAADGMSRQALDRVASGDDKEAARTIALAVDDFSTRLTQTIERFMPHPEWQGIERIVIGGGFKETEICEHAIRAASLALADQGLRVELKELHHAADDGGLVGWVQLCPLPLLHRPFLAIDIGGTNVRCGIVQSTPPVEGGKPRVGKAPPRVLKREKWSHAGADATQGDLLEGMVDMLQRLIEQAPADGIELAPFVGIACPGVIRNDGSIALGAQNLPGDWQGGGFKLPTFLRKRVPTIGGVDTLIALHNDAVIQGLSELPYTLDVGRWAVLTIGTGLGNASFTNKGVAART